MAILKFKKFVVIGCSHGHLADPAALETVLKFNREFKPTLRYHLGDFVDMAAFRGGAKDTPDESASVKDDLTSGLTFLRAYNPTHMMNGNHEIRLWKLAESNNQIIATAAQSVIDELKSLADKLGAEYLESYDINKSWMTLADYKLMHGWMFGENALREHGEHFGNVMIAHLHKASDMTIKRSDHPRALCTGTLANVGAMSYANTRRATASWSHGLISGETDGKVAYPTLHCAPQGQPGGWRIA